MIIYTGWVLALVVPMVVIHESIHALCGWLLGFDIGLDIEVVSWFDWTAFTIPYGDYQTRLETVVIALAPLVVMTPLGALLFAVGDQAHAIAAALLVMFNAAGSVGDISTTLLMLALPSGALVRHDSTGREQYYVLEKSA